MPKTGRPRALDDLKRRDVCTLTTLGYSIDCIARFIGCAPSTIRRELRRNPEFNEKLRQASLACELGPLHTIRQAALTNHRAAIWWMERMNPQRFAKRNIRYITPELLNQLFESYTAAIFEEVHDEKAYQRVRRKLGKFVAYANRQIEDEFEMFPPPRRRPNQNDAFPLPADANPIEHVKSATETQNPTSKILPLPLGEGGGGSALDSGCYSI